MGKKFFDPVEFDVLRNINISLFKGEFASIIGASGSGKSTLLYILSTLDTNYTGTLYLENENLALKNKNQLAEIRNEKLGFVFQFHYLLADFTVLENVMLPALKLGKYSREIVEEKALKKLELLGITEHAYKKASKLSGGQQQRVAIARALINDPLIVFGDEPTSNLDSKNSDLVFGILQDLKNELNQTILVVTHDLNFAKKTDRIIKLHDGEIVESKEYQFKLHG